MNYIDIILGIFLLFAIWKGFRKGLIIEIFTLLALLVGIYAGINFSDWTSQKLTKNFDISGNYLPVIAFTITFLAVGAMVYFAGKALEKIVEVAHLSLVNRLLGILFSLIKTLYFLSIIIILIETYDERNKFVPKSLKQESLLYYPIQKIATTTIPKVKESMIWLENKVPTNIFYKTEEKIQNLNTLQQQADSLGISIDQLIQLKKIQDSLSKE